MSSWVFDIEANGYLEEADRIWIVVAHNLDTHELRYWLEGDLGWQEVFNSATKIVGHFITGYDIPLLEKLTGWVPPKSLVIHDTLIMSRILDYKRFGEDGHSLEVWGRHLNHPKFELEDFSQYTEETKIRCISDVELNVMIYRQLSSEFNRLHAKNPHIATYMKAEHYAARWNAEAKKHGWPFDRRAAWTLYETLAAEMEDAYRTLETKLGMKAVAVDKKNGYVEPKRPKWIKMGCYDAFTSNWFGVDPFSGFEGEERPIEGEYCRVVFEPLSLNSVSDVKIFLFRHGWSPTTWNFKTNEFGKKVKTSPKITEDSLEFLGGDGAIYTRFATTRSRYNILKTWLHNVDEDGNLHGDAELIGTPSMRSRHSIIVNVPSVDSLWGPEMRKLFIAKPGWKLIGCDSSGNQARGLAYYLGDEDYIHTLLTGDIHNYNKNKLNEVLEDMGYEPVVTRPQAKRILYAFLFGASGGKLWSYIFGFADEENGKRLKNGFIKAVPGFKDLIEKLAKIFSETKKYGLGYIPSLAGNKLYVDSYHKLLVYLLQAFEKITCSTALMLIMQRLEEENIPYIPCIYYHDEADFMVPDEWEPRAKEIGQQAFADGPKLYGVSFMDGGAKSGDNWCEVH
jgi:DNA polymerase-1